MKFGRFLFGEKVFWGRVEGDEIAVLKIPPQKGLIESGEVFNINEVKILPPVVPTKIVGVGLNYRKHAEEMGKPLPAEPLIFLKPSTAVIGPEDNIILPPVSERVDYEGELGVVIKKACKNVAVEEASECIMGFTCFNDVTARDLQAKDVQYTRAKGFDTFAPVGPFIETDINPDEVEIKTYLNGEIRQHSSTADMIFNVYQLVSFISGVMTLLPGDVIATGTPPGVGKLSPGDRVSIEIDGIGTLSNYVVAVK